jgi:flagellar biosynthetic protein FliP
MRPIRLFVMLLVLAAGPSALAQRAPAPQPAPMAGQAQPSNLELPKMGDVISAVEKATTPAAGKGGDWAGPVKLAVVFTLLALLPSLMVMMTSFTRIVIVLGFVRRALTTQTIPPTIAIIGLAVFLTLFTMAPTLGRMNEQALQPYLANQLDFAGAAQRGDAVLKDFMLRQTRHSDLALFMDLARLAPPASPGQLPTHVVIPAFAISEFRTAFEMGCLLFIPFLLIDLVVSSILLSTGMMMLPPTMISLPFKIILFVLVDGWRLMAKTLVASFN